jgi:hypothetical protein
MYSLYVKTPPNVKATMDSFACCGTTGQPWPDMGEAWPNEARYYFQYCDFNFLTQLIFIVKLFNNALFNFFTAHCWVMECHGDL